MNLDLEKSANILINAMKKHSNNEVKNNAIKEIHKIGYIKQILDNNLYLVVIDEEEFKMGTREGLTLSINDTVIIMLFNGDINRAWIIDKKTWNYW